MTDATEFIALVGPLVLPCFVTAYLDVRDVVFLGSSDVHYGTLGRSFLPLEVAGIELPLVKGLRINGRSIGRYDTNPNRTVFP